jgi:TolB protein
MQMISKLTIHFSLLIILALTGLTSPARAVVEIDITKGNVEPLPIAITDFVGTGPQRQMASDIGNVITSNLKNTG